MKKTWLYIGCILIASVASANDSQDFAGLHDPTSPAYYSMPVQKIEAKSLELIMTFVSGNSKIAIINGTTYEEGAIIDGFQIKKIEQNKVYLVSVVGEQSMVLVPKKNPLIKPVVGVSR
jgi:hypothetical protein